MEFLKLKLNMLFRKNRSIRVCTRDTETLNYNSSVGPMKTIFKSEWLHEEKKIQSLQGGLQSEYYQGKTEYLPEILRWVRGAGGLQDTTLV